MSSQIETRIVETTAPETAPTGIETPSNPELRYKLAYSDGDYAAAQALFDKEEFFAPKPEFPTVMCFEGERLIGAFATQLLPDMIVAGPMAMEPHPDGKNRVGACLKMCEAYEATLRSLGIESYIFSIEEGSSLARAVSWYTPDIEPYAKEGSKLFFVRKLNGRQ